MIISAIGGITSPIKIETAGTAQVDSAIARQIENKKSAKEIENAINTEEYVKEYFSDIPIMIQIAKCESHFRQFDKDGNVHRGVENDKDVGVMQINEFYHLDQAESGNYNIYTLPGNTAYARELYEREGTTPWNSSKFCWGKYRNKDLALSSKS